MYPPTLRPPLPPNATRGARGLCSARRTRTCTRWTGRRRCTGRRTRVTPPLSSSSSPLPRGPLHPPPPALVACPWMWITPEPSTPPIPPPLPPPPKAEPSPMAPEGPSDQGHREPREYARAHAPHPRRRGRPPRLRPPPRRGPHPILPLPIPPAGPRGVGSSVQTVLRD